MSGPILLVIRILIALSLFAFLGLAFTMLWNDLRKQSQHIAAPVPALQLIPPDGSQAFHFSQAEINIGRDPACDCFIPDKTVSTQHARLAYKHDRWWLEDLHSTNGTFLNQEPVAAPLVVTDGDQLRCGQVVLEIKIGA